MAINFSLKKNNIQFILFSAIIAFLLAGKLLGLRRLADESGLFKIVAVDQRPPIQNEIKS